MVFLKVTATGFQLSIHTQPNASRTAIVGLHGEALKVAVHAPPVDGAANQEILDFLRSLFQVKKSQVAFVSGEKSRQKKIQIEGIPLDQAKSILQGFLK